MTDILLFPRLHIDQGSNSFSSFELSATSMFAYQGLWLYTFTKNYWILNKSKFTIGFTLL